jgi:hypothetical protein
MTITSIDSGLGYVLVFTTWFDDTNELRSGSFPPDALAKDDA